MTKETTFENQNLITVFGQNKTVNAGSVSSNLINYISNIKTTFGQFSLPSSIGVDSNWYSNNIYYIDAVSKKVIKRNIKGILLNEIQLVNPISISVIQPTTRMIYEYDGTKDVGFWVVDAGSQSIYKFNEEFEIEVEIKNVIASLIRSSMDGGCIFYETTNKKLVKYSSTGFLESWFDKSEFTYPFNSNEDVIDIKRDNDDNFWILRPLLITKIKFQDDKMTEVFTSPFNTIFSETTSKVLMDVDIGFKENEFNESSSSLSSEEEYPEEVYLLNYSGSCEIVVLNQNGNIARRKRDLEIINPIVLLVTQAAQSKGVYVLSSGELFECGTDLTNGNFSVIDMSKFETGGETIWTNENNVPCWSTSIPGNISNKIKIIDSQSGSIESFDERYFVELKGSNDFGWGIKQNVDVSPNTEYEFGFKYKAKNTYSEPDLDNLIQNGDFSQIDFNALDGSVNDLSPYSGVIQVDDGFVPGWSCFVPDPNNGFSGIELWNDLTLVPDLSSFTAQKGHYFCELQCHVGIGWGIEQTILVDENSSYALSFYHRSRSNDVADVAIERFYIYINGVRQDDYAQDSITSVWEWSGITFSVGNGGLGNGLFSLKIGFLPDILSSGGCLIDNISLNKVGSDLTPENSETFNVKVNSNIEGEFTPTEKDSWKTGFILFNSGPNNNLTFSLEPKSLSGDGCFVDGIYLSKAAGTVVWNDKTTSIDATKVIVDEGEAYDTLSNTAIGMLGIENMTSWRSSGSDPAASPTLWIDGVGGTMDFSEAIKLTSLTATYHSLDYLDISNNLKLTILKVYHNNLENLNISNNTKLDYCDCSNNNLTNLSLIGITNLRHLYCGNNLLTVLNGSYITRLVTISCEDNLLTSFIPIVAPTEDSDLKIFYAQNNNLTTINLTAYLGLEEINLQNNQLTSVFFSDFGEHGNSPISINLSDNNLSSIELDRIFTNLPNKSQSLSSIKVEGNPGSATCDASIATLKGWTVTQ